MMHSSIKAVLQFIFVIGLFYGFTASGRAAAKLCKNHPVGSPISNIKDIKGSFLLKRMGPSPDPDQPGAEYAIFCANFTMCDTSCRLTVKDGVVAEARFLAL